MRSADDIPIGHLVWLLAMRWRSAIDAELHDIGLSHATYVLLSSLKSLTTQGSLVTQKQLGEYTGLEPMYVSRLVKQLEGLGFVKRVADDDDGRVQRVSLTTSSNRLLKRCIPRVQELMGELTAPVSEMGRENSLRLDLCALLDVSPSQHQIRSQK